MKNAESAILALSAHRAFDAEGPLAFEMEKDVAEAWPEAYASSLCASRGRVFAIAGRGADKRLVIISPGKDAQHLAADIGFEAENVETVSAGGIFIVLTCALTAANAAALRKEFPFTAPTTGGIATAFGLGDRIGIQTPGHIRAVREYNVFPILAQQSIREMHRTCRSPLDVINDASWAVFQEGYRRPFGADADHLKTEDDVRLTAAAGFNMFTIDPSEHINNRADDMGPGELAEHFDMLFGRDHESRHAMLNRYVDREIELSDNTLGMKHTFSIKPPDVMRIAVKYLPAVRHTVSLVRVIESLPGGSGFDIEMSVDETETPTTPEAHLFVAMELKESGVKVQSLAPRFVGEFQKGIDFIGDVAEFTATVKLHALIARTMGPYKLSIHSGSDKFSIFPIVARATAGTLHEKTAGTSYLEAIRVIARRAPALYREIHAFALERFEEDRASYHVTTNLANVPPLDTLSDADLPALMDKVDSRQLIHITYGSALTAKNADGSPRFRDRILQVLNDNEEEHYETLAGHIRRHCVSLNLKKI